MHTSFKLGNHAYFIRTLGAKKECSTKEITDKVFLIMMGHFFES